MKVFEIDDAVKIKKEFRRMSFHNQPALVVGSFETKFLGTEYNIVQIEFCSNEKIESFPAYQLEKYIWE